jgi:hypothetical protein
VMFSPRTVDEILADAGLLPTRPYLLYTADTWMGVGPSRPPSKPENCAGCGAPPQRTGRCEYCGRVR